jgi:hypothetical protein
VCNEAIATLKVLIAVIRLLMMHIFAVFVLITAQEKGSHILGALEQIVAAIVVDGRRRLCGLVRIGLRYGALVADNLAEATDCK